MCKDKVQDKDQTCKEQKKDKDFTYNNITLSLIG